MRAVRVHAFGGPEQMRFEEIPLPTPGAGQARVKVGASGVNYIDVYYRSGQYKAELPFTLGQEGAGTVDAVGDGVTDVSVGDRVAWAMVPGSYATHALVPSSRLIRLPDGIDFAQATAAMLQGMTAHYLTHSTYALKPGDACLVHAAAGGVGLLLCQMAKRLGARVIGTVSNEAKARLAREAGADEVILYSQEDFVPAVQRLTREAGVQVVYDSVGKDTFERGFACLAPRGMMALFGQSSGKVDPLDPQVLAARGSLFLTRPSLAHYVAKREELEARAGTVLGWVADGSLKLRVDHTYSLGDAAEAHRALMSRETTGKLLLLPDA